MVRLTDRLDMTLGVYRGRKTTMQQQQQSQLTEKMCVNVLLLQFYIRFFVKVLIERNVNISNKIKLLMFVEV